MTAMIDLMLNLGIPQSPCPEVHPLLNLVPKPTSKPPSANPTYDVKSVISFSGPNGVKPL